MILSSTRFYLEFLASNKYFSFHVPSMFSFFFFISLFRNVSIIVSNVKCYFSSPSTKKKTQRYHRSNDCFVGYSIPTWKTAKFNSSTRTLICKYLAMHILNHENTQICFKRAIWKINSLNNQLSKLYSTITNALARIYESKKKRMKRIE